MRNLIKKNKLIKHNMWMAFLFVVGIFCLLYFSLLLIRVGVHSFFFVFPVASIGCFMLMLICHLHHRGVWKISRWLIWAFRGMVALALLVFAVLLGMILHGQSVGPETDADYLVVLGAGLRGERPSLVLQKRIDAAAEYLQNNPSTQVVVSGGRGPDELISEAEAMRRGLVAKGISEDRIYLEDASTSTSENLTYSLAYFEPDAKVVVVTNKFHVFRACHIARECGYRNVSGLGAGNVVWLNLTNYIRESLAVFKDVVL